MAKKVSMTPKPSVAKDIEEWVGNKGTESESKAEPEEKMKRLTLDIPHSLHTAIKRRAVDEGVAMADMLRELLTEHYL